MSLRTLIADWTLDGSLGLAFLMLVLALGLIYLLATRAGTRRDRRGRRWPQARTFCFLAGLLALVIDLYSGIGSQADSRPAAHMVEHMILWLVVAPLVVAAAPVRLALFALPKHRRRILARWLHSPLLRALTGPFGSGLLFASVLIITALPGVYDLTLGNDYLHEAEHGIYLIAAVLLWAPLLGVDPLPHRPGRRAQLACLTCCMLVMAGIGVWLVASPEVVYTPYRAGLGAGALGDQHLAGGIMLIGGLPAFAVPALIRGGRSGRPSNLVGRQQVAA